MTPRPASDGPVPLARVAPAGGRAARARGYAAANAIVLPLLLLVLWLAWMAEPADGRIVLFGYRLPEGCIYKRMLGRPCLGCGITRSLVLAADARWAESRAMHPSGVWLLGFLLCQVLFRTVLLVIRPPAGTALCCVDPIVSAVLLLLVLYLPLVL